MAAKIAKFPDGFRDSPRILGGARFQSGGKNPYEIRFTFNDFKQNFCLNINNPDDPDLKQDIRNWILGDVLTSYECYKYKNARDVSCDESTAESMADWAVSMIVAAKLINSNKGKVKE